MSICFGVDYYPEHWPRERWDKDARLMKGMGIDVVRLAEFSWGMLEPRQGQFNFSWLDEAVSLLASYGIKSILCTPTAAPPAWIIADAPDIQPVHKDGGRRYFGSRHHDCQSNPIYRDHIRRYVTAFAEHFGKNPHVIGWQIDNELGNSHDDLCFCESCEQRFREWLQKRYGDIETLNQQWGTAFWSQTYQSFTQIQVPKLVPAGPNPSALLDWKRFCSDLIVDFHRFQADILRATAPKLFITHNMMGFAEKVSYFDLGADLDFASHDQYPGGHFIPVVKHLANRQAAALDFIRSVKQKTYWIMEQQAGMTGWDVMGRAPKPGQLPLWAMQSVAHGADTVVFFRWRTCTMGTEQYWHGILPHSGIPGRYYHELKDFMQKTRPLLKEIQGGMPKTEVGIVFSYDQSYAMSVQPHHPDLHYTEHLLVYYQPLFDRNVPVDFVRDTADFSRYKLIIAPLQYLMTPGLEEKYKLYVKNGGMLVLTMRTGVKNSSNICMSDTPLPGGLRDLAGLEVPEYDCLREASAFVNWDGRRYMCEKWCDILNATSASPLAVYDSEFYSGTPAITVNDYGKGKAYYVGTEPGPELAAKLIDELLRVCDIHSLGDTADGLEIAHRVLKNKEYYFVMNHTDTIQTFVAPNCWVNYIGDDSTDVHPHSYRVYVSARD